MSSWRDDLQEASFRGVEFEVEGESGKFGRRVQTHEYPQRDKPYTEDLGRATRELTIAAFVIDDDYMQRRDALLAALETEGPGTLVHPWYGRMQVNVKEVTVTHSRTDGGMCEFALVFVESGELTFPSAADSHGAQSLLAADRLDVVSQNDFLRDFSLTAMPSFVGTSATTDLTGFVDLVGKSGVKEMLASGSSSLLDIGKSLSGALAGPQSLARGVLDLFNRGAGVLKVADSALAMFGKAGISTRIQSSIGKLTNMAGAFGEIASLPNALLKAGSAFSTNDLKNLPEALTKAAHAISADIPTLAPVLQAQLNKSALAKLFQRSSLIQAAGMTASMALPVYDDAIKIRDTVTAALDHASTSASDPVYVALQDLRGKVHQDITSRLAQSARLLTVTPAAVGPALAMAYDLYEDPVGREAELVERNGVRRPGFVPATTQRVLSA